MKNIYKLILFLLFSILITACSSKKITIKSLHPSKIQSEKFSSVYVENFENDDIYQSLKIQNKLTHKTIDGKKIFRVLNTLENIDIIIQGTTSSNLNYSIYYQEEIDYKRCRYYRHEDKNKKRKCAKYYYRMIPCENREYNVKTNLKLIKQSTNQILFAKTYNKSQNIHQCFKYSYYPYNTIPRNKREINIKLAALIADEFLDDISPHYKYWDIKIIDKLNKDSLLFTDEQSSRFVEIVELIEKRNFDLSLSLLNKLNIEFDNNSYEVIYNMALIYEAKANLYEANKLYKKAKFLVKDLDDLSLINNGILRTKTNLEEKIKAKSQLP